MVFVNNSYNTIKSPGTHSPDSINEVIVKDEIKCVFLKKCFICFLVVVVPVSAFTILIISEFDHHHHYEKKVEPFGLWRKENFFTGKKDIIQNYQSHFGSFFSNYYMRKWTYRKAAEEDNFSVDMPSPPVPKPEQCSKIIDSEKFDCMPRGEVNEKSCSAKGCCYAETKVEHVPYCFYPREYKSYKYTSFTKTSFGYNATMAQQFKSSYPKDLPKLKMNVIFASNDVLMIGITDEKNTAFVSPFPELPGRPLKPPENPLYDVIFDNDTVGFRVIRRSNNLTLFDTLGVGGFIFSEQLLQISALLPSNYLFGLGESRHSFLVGTAWRTITLHNHDGIPTNNVNGYGSHPVYLCMEPGGLAHGVSVLSSFSMDVVLQPAPAITYRILGGALVFSFVLGPSPLQVNTQYTSLVGRPFLPPYWALGFHLCRFGYKTLNDTIRIWNQTRNAGIPFDVQWNDLDYMKNRNDFTLDEEAFKGLPDFVNHLHDVGMHYVILIDPGVSGSEPPGTYPPYDEGVKLGIFIKDSKGKEPLRAKVWNYNSTVFPDFSHPQVVGYWTQLINDFHNILPFDGAWIDMNEPSNMVDGSLTGCPKNDLENPPYVPGVAGGQLSSKTVCMSAKHFTIQHYFLHNIYASLEAVVTSFAMMNARDGGRPLVISRASSPGLGAFAGHWTGDVRSTWDDMAQSIPDMLSFSLFGIPLVGADICGFNGNTTVALCNRWTQLGAFYPFSRNHNTDDGIAQDPVSLGLGEVARRSLQLRYLLLPYLYTLFWQAHNTGAPVLRPTFYISPQDENTYDLEEQFMWGDALLIAPVLQEGITYTTPYLPAGLWYLLDETLAASSVIESKGEKISVSAPLDSPPPLLLRAGCILPAQAPANNTLYSRKNPFKLAVGLNASGQASGYLYWDDGDTYEGKHNLIGFIADKATLKSEVTSWDYQTDMLLDEVFIYSNFTSDIKKVTVGGEPSSFELKLHKYLRIHDFNLDLKNEFYISWFS